MINHTERIKQTFNHAALTYDAFSTTQQIIGTKLIHLMSNFTLPFDNIIDLGCGTGIISKLLIEGRNFKQFFAIDLADKLLQQAKTRLNQDHCFIANMDFENLHFPDKYFNLLFSNMALHWSNHVPAIFSLLNKKIVEQGMLTFTIPLAGTFAELTSWQKNSFYTYQKINEFIHNSGFEIIFSQEETESFHFTNLHAALQSIKATGTNYIFRRKTTSIMQLRGLLTEKTTLTYNIGYYILRKKFHVT